MRFFVDACVDLRAARLLAMNSKTALDFGHTDTISPFNSSLHGHGGPLREQDIEVSLSQLNELVIGSALPIGLAYGRDLVSGQEVAGAGIKTLVYQDTHSARSCSLAISRN
jgi:hypothetical protein